MTSLWRRILGFAGGGQRPATLQPEPQSPPAPVQPPPMAAPGDAAVFDHVPSEEALCAAVGTERYVLWMLLQDLREARASRGEDIGDALAPEAMAVLQAQIAADGALSALDVGGGLAEVRGFWARVSPHALQGAAQTWRALGDFLPFADGAFDLVTFAGTADRQIDPARAFAEARRVLKPGGRLLVLQTVRPDDDRYRTWRAQAVACYDPLHAHAFTAQSLPEAIAAAGFAVKESQAAGDGVVVRAIRP